MFTEDRGMFHPRQINRTNDTFSPWANSVWVKIVPHWFSTWTNLSKDTWTRLSVWIDQWRDWANEKKQGSLFDRRRTMTHRYHRKNCHQNSRRSAVGSQLDLGTFRKRVFHRDRTRSNQFIHSKEVRKKESWFAPFQTRNTLNSEKGESRWIGEMKKRLVKSPRGSQLKEDWMKKIRSRLDEWSNWFLLRLDNEWTKIREDFPRSEWSFIFFGNNRVDETKIIDQGPFDGFSRRWNHFSNRWPSVRKERETFAHTSKTPNSANDSQKLLDKFGHRSESTWEWMEGTNASHRHWKGRDDRTRWRKLFIPSFDFVVLISFQIDPSRIVEETIREKHLFEKKKKKIPRREKLCRGFCWSMSESCSICQTKVLSIVPSSSSSFSLMSIWQTFLWDHLNS